MMVLCLYSENPDPSRNHRANTCGSFLAPRNAGNSNPTIGLFAGCPKGVK